MVLDRSFQLPNRLKEFTSFLVMDVLDRANELERRGHPMVHLEVGEPDFKTPRKILEAGQKALAEGKTHYTPSLGIYPLREAISEWYRKKYRVTVSPERIIVTMGTSPGLLLILSTLLNPGDEIILTNPGYACYANFIRFLEGVPVFVKVREEDGFQCRTAYIRAKITERTRAILINSPSNPTGHLLPPEEMAEISRLRLPVISDEIYHGLVYGEKAHSFLELSQDAFVLNGFSKYFAMTGWRLGYIIVPDEYVRPIQKLQQNFFISSNTVAQYAGIVALNEEHPELEEMKQKYNKRRKYMIQRLREMGFGIAVEPTGAFYVFANAGKFTDDSLKFSFELLENAHVAVAPGIDFGSNGEGYMRFSYANSLEAIENGMNRLEAYLKSRSRPVRRSSL
ncbi:MAG TPA: pyridoxal phosphate-dependent aminotransferase [Bacteroidetes bacterium]|nr:pyridoxal phosphate-dependent aminotransferase [Bacteroidota bacterium]